MRDARLRPEDPIDARRELAELWHWRSRTRELVESGHDFAIGATLRSAGIHGIDDIVRRSAHIAQELEGGAEPIGDDFPAFGKAYRDLDENEWSAVRSVSIERHFALNWLCGYAPDNRWDETPTDT